VRDKQSSQEGQAEQPRRSSIAAKKAQSYSPNNKNIITLIESPYKKCPGIFQFCVKTLNYSHQLMDLN